MKTSRRLMLATFLTLLATPVVIVAYGRISGAGTMSELPGPRRASAAELAALRDFSAIDVRGDLDVVIRSAADFAISYTPLFERRGNIAARVENGTLFVVGYANRSETEAAQLEISLPALTRVESESLFALTVSGFSGTALDVVVPSAQRVVIEDNQLATLRMELGYVGRIEQHGNTIGTSEVTHFDATFTTD
ncbi:MAG: hypothetical protein ACO1PZ_14350 [Gammaproteobacteria bacterium]